MILNSFISDWFPGDNNCTNDTLICHGCHLFTMSVVLSSWRYLALLKNCTPQKDAGTIRKVCSALLPSTIVSGTLITYFWKLFRIHHQHTFSVRLLQLLLSTVVRVLEWPVVVPNHLPSSHYTPSKHSLSSMFMWYCQALHKNTSRTTVSNKKWVNTVPIQSSPPFSALLNCWNICCLKKAFTGQHVYPNGTGFGVKTSA